MKKLILLFVLCFATPLYAQVLPPVGSGSVSGGSTAAAGATTCGGLADSGTGCATNVGPLATQGAITAQGVIASGGTLTCPFSATTTVCTATVGGGNFTIGTPTGGVVNTEYQVILTSTASVTATFSAGWVIFSYLNNATATPTAFTTLNSGNTTTINFKYNGTNYALDQLPASYAFKIIAGSINTGALAGSSGTFTGLLNTQAVAAASLPATCVKNAIITVTDATSLTAGVCVGGGSTSVLAICSATNTWSCL